MDTELVAKLTLAAYAVTAISVIVWQVRRWRIGWQVWMLYAVQRLYCGMVFRWRSDGRCPFPEEGPALIIANHRSPIDPMMVWMNHHLGGKTRRIRVINFMMAKEYYEMPMLHWMFRSLRSISVERDGRDMRPVREALRRLNKGELVGVFPEGRLNLGTGLLEGNPGVAWLALKAKVAVYPVFIHNAPQGEHMSDPFYTLSRVRVSYGNAIDLSQFHSQSTSRELLNEITELLMQRLAETGGLDSNDIHIKPTLPIDRATG